MAATVTRRTIDLAGLDVPFIEINGSEDGPLLTVVSGVHGCEYASMAGARRWTRSLEGRDLRGRVRAVPVLNLPAFRARTPFVVPDDGKNLNRCFPGDASGTLADRLAYAVFHELITGSDAYIDAHCGDMVEALEPFTLYEAGPAPGRGRHLHFGRGRDRRARDHRRVRRVRPGPGGCRSAACARAQRRARDARHGRPPGRGTRPARADPPQQVPVDALRPGRLVGA